MTEKDDRPGVRFSQVYARRGEPTDDSLRMRRRIAGLISENEYLNQKLKGAIERDIGIEAPYIGSWAAYLDKIELQDLLDLITVAFKLMMSMPYGALDARKWLINVQQIFQEENVHYRLEPQGGVRFLFDESFEQTRAAAIAALSAPRYANSLAEFEKGMAAFSQAMPDGKSAIRSIFTALEGLFALMFPEVRRLAAGEVSHLRPSIEQVYSGDRRPQDASKESLRSLAEWIDAAHHYRHEEGRPDTVAQPPLTLALYLVSTGAAHLRWIAEIDAATER